MAQIDPIQYELSGGNLIEASAGTGKTYTIETLYLRLLMEKQLTVEQILVVTFTRMATAELVDRLRKILLATREALRNPLAEPKEKRLRALLEKWRGSGIAEEELRRKCQDAIAEFDRAPISTIHGFCERILRDNAFESGTRFGRQLAERTDDIMAEGFRKFFRSACYNAAHPQRPLLLKAAGLATPGDFQKCLSTVVREEVEDDFIEGGHALRLEEVKAIFLEVEEQVAAWRETQSPQAGEDELAARLKTELAEELRRYKATMLLWAKRLVGNELLKEKSRQNIMTYGDLLKELRKHIGEPALQEAIRRKHPCAIIDEFQDTDFVQNEIFRKIYLDGQEGASECTFFMIGDPKQAIYAFRGGDLPAYQQAIQARAITHRYSLSTNYRSSKNYIDAMNKLFSESNLFAKDKLDVQVGAPEYAPELQLDGQPWPPAGSALLLSHNPHKSKSQRISDLISAIRQLMSMRLKIRIRPDEPFRDFNYGDIAVLAETNKQIKEEIEPELNANRIPCSTVGNVNVFSRPQAGILKEFLEHLQNAAFLPEVVRAMAMPFFPFALAQLDELQENGQIQFREWMVSLSELWRRKSFLAMFEALLGATAKEMFGDAVPECLRGAVSGTVAQTIAARPNGHDALAVYRQLAEVLNAMAVEQRLGPSALLAAFQEGLERSGNTSDIPDGEELRLTSQEPAVRVMTIHKSKGLQFPCVFVYGLLGKAVEGRYAYSPAFYHDERNMRIVLADPSLEGARSAEIREKGKRELSEELLRIFYVAVTRARFFVRFLDGKADANSFWQRILGGKKPSKGKARSVAAVPADSGWPTVAGSLPQIEAFPGVTAPPDGSGGDSSAAERPACPVGEKFDADFFFRRGWESNSFTSLGRLTEQARQEFDEALKGDDDEEPPPLSPEERRKLPPLFQLPCGKGAGTRWHKFFEMLDFQQDEKNLPGLLEKFSLLEDGSAPARDAKNLQSRADAAREMVRCVLQNKLPKPLEINELYNSGPLSSSVLGFGLSDIRPENRRAELNFTYWLKEPRGNLLGGLEGELSRHGIQVPPGWERRPSGALTGSIDLLFQGPDGKYYILDWKTNTIGCRAENFGAAGLKKEMDRHFYHLQYLVYIVAFFHFYQSLEPRWEFTEVEYDRLFGGVFYVFLRGVEAGGARGIYAVRPSFQLVKGIFGQLDARQASGGRDGN